MEKVSVIMPAYNAAGFIKESILGVLNQTYQDYHLYVIDDASTDHTAEVVKPFIHDRFATVMTFGTRTSWRVRSVFSRPTATTWCAPIITPLKMTRRG